MICIDVNSEEFIFDDDNDVMNFDNEDNEYMEFCLINKSILAKNIVEELVNDNKIVLDDVDYAIWNIIDEIGAEIKNCIYSYTDEKNIKFIDFD